MYTQILVPLDGSKLAEKAISHAQGLAEAYGATVHLLQVLPQNPSGGSLREDSPDAGEGAFHTALTSMAGSTPTGNATTPELVRRLKENQTKEAQGYLANMATDLENQGLNVETQLQEGPPHERIAEYAKQSGIDIIVMSTHGHGGVKRLIMGSVTDRVIRSGDVPVLVIT